MKILFYGESPCNPTGFVQVNKHLARAFSKVAEVTMVATTHYHPLYDQKEFPFTIVGCDDVPGEQRTLDHQRNLLKIKQHLADLDWDVFVYQGDMGWNNDILEIAGNIQKEHPEKNTVFYMPIDGDFSMDYAFTPFTWCSVPVVYTEHAKSVIEKYAPEVAAYTSVIWLGCEPDVFYPLSAEEKRKARIRFFGDAYQDRFICINVNRNQARKDLMRSLAIFHAFHEKHLDSSMYMHSVIADVGGSLVFQAQVVGCDVYKSPAEIIFSGLSLAEPWSRSMLNEMYNAADCLISTSTGEGWGLTTTEAMCAGIPVIVPHNTANLDILGPNQERGYGVRTGGDLDHTTFIYTNGNSKASVPHSEHFLEQLDYVYHHREESAQKALAAREWCVKNPWERREAEWVQLLETIKASMNTTQL